MQFRIYSDLHLELGDFQPIADPDDIIILAGDIHEGPKALEWIEHHFTGHTVLYIAGNHEFHHRQFQSYLEFLKTHPKIIFLENQSIVIENVRILGCSLWTDFNLYRKQKEAIQTTLQSFSDFQNIQFENRSFTHKDQIRIHQDSRQWLDSELSQNFHGQNMVITHHAPSPRSLSKDLENQPIAAAFASDLEDIIWKHQPSLWIHGHIHYARDYKIGNTRVISNPKGNPNYPSVGFDPDKKIVIQ